MTPRKKKRRNSSKDNFPVSLLKTISVRKSDAVIVLKNKNRIIYCSEAAAKILKGRKENLVDTKYPYQPNSDIKTSARNGNEIVYSSHTFSLTIKKEKFDLIILKKTIQKLKSRKQPGIIDEEDIIRSQTMLQLVLNNIPQRFFWKDRNFRYLGCNRAFAVDAHLKEPSEIIGKDDFELSWKDTAELYRKDDSEVMETGIPKINYEEPQTTPDRENLWLRTSKIPLYDDNENIIGVLGTYEDITERKKMEERFSTDRKLLSAIISNLPEQIYVKDLESRFLFCSKALVENAASINPKFQNEEDIIGKTDFDIFPAEIAAEYREYEKELMESGESVINKEESFRGKISLTTKVPMKDESGKIIGLIGMNRDITERKQSEEKLKNERILLRTIIDNLPDAIYTKDINCRKTLANKADLYNLGCKDEAESLGKTDFDFYSEDTAYVFYQDDLSVLRDGKSILNRDESFIDKNGNVRWLLTSKIPLYDADGKIVGLVGIGHDITERKKSELLNEALYKISEAAFTAIDIDTLYRNIHEVIKTLMPANNFFIALYDDNTEQPAFPYFVDEHGSNNSQKKLEKVLTEYILRSEEAVLINANKYNELMRICEVEAVNPPAAILLGVPLKIGGKVIGVIVVRDYKNERAYMEDEMQLLIFVSNQIAQAIERKKNSEAIKKYVDELKLLNKTKDKFFSIIAHDLKNPFITILGFCDLILSDYAELTEEEKLFYIKEMKKSADLNHNLLQNLLQWSRSQTGKIEFSPQKLELIEVINENFLLLSKSAEKKQIQLLHSIAGNLRVTADGDMLNTIMRNLLTNAIKFSRKGGKIKVTAEQKNNFVELCVMDHGVGMDQITLNYLFKLDAAHSTIGTENELGTGLGLILCKEFIEKNGGKIWVESEVGKGSKFYFTLPA